ncbi:MAG: biotin--[acetyl-CoA-carboxylase] ligase [Pelagibacteraceae bacterium TMED237]|nr:biotin--[acetyl-CoA-carboxylase] ligase [Candidatus Neomarinimicrobiota bacterium]OUW96301.1 MAG: biotin--[acetyl-CoA-carboxylase] ligase [Pelagibacteraceae bacterium TMED237]
MFIKDLFRSKLNTKKIAKKIYHIKITDSTNNQIYTMFQNEEIDIGDILISEKQINGKGRRGNKWFSSSGKNLTFSFILNSDSNNMNNKIPLISGISIIKAIKQLTNLECYLKWPNDIIHDNKKLGGILIESKKNKFIIGIGINVNEINFDKTIRDTACSLKTILNNTIERECLLAFIFNNFEKLLNEKNENIIKMWENKCNHLNKSVKFFQSNKLVTGKFLGLNINGEAKLKINDKYKAINSGVIYY